MSFSYPPTSPGISSQQKVHVRRHVPSELLVSSDGRITSPGWPTSWAEPRGAWGQAFGSQVDKEGNCPWLPADVPAEHFVLQLRKAV